MGAHEGIPITLRVFIRHQTFSFSVTGASYFFVCLKRIFEIPTIILVFLFITPQKMTT